MDALLDEIGRIPFASGQPMDASTLTALSAEESMRRALLIIVKAAISGFLLFLALDSVDIGMMSDRLSRLNLGWIAIEILVLVILIFVAAVRWREITRLCGISLLLPQAFRYSMIAEFFNQTLPSTVGGDAVSLLFGAGSFVVGAFGGLIWIR